MQQLQLSGYNEHERYKILVGCVNTPLSLKGKEENRLRPYYRSSEYKRMNKSIKKCKKSKIWFREDDDVNQMKMLKKY